jgi:hypothetical protein
MIQYFRNCLKQTEQFLPFTVSSSTAKRLILYRFDRQPLEALAHADSYLSDVGVEVMTRDGNLQVIGYKDVKALCFGAQGAPADLFTSPAVFERRPKTAGLWTSFVLRDGDILEGVLPHNLLEWPKQGYLLTPPRAGAYRQRVFIPRLAVRETVLRGMVGKPLQAFAKKSAQPGAVDADRQLSMFD